MLRKLILALLMTLSSFAVWASPVNVNQADAEAISASLKSIGLVKAQAIVDYREQHGAFKSLAELTNVKGIGIRTVEMNADNILLEEPKP